MPLPWPTVPPLHGFVRGYHLTELPHAVTNIERQRLKVCTFADANDPFELLALCAPGRGQRATRKLLQQFKDSQTRQTGMLCFSRSWHNPVMWSHYARGHTGVCLGFDVRSNCIENVIYVPDRLTAPLDRSDADPDASMLPESLQNDLFVTKFDHWQYENEFRRFVPLAKASHESERNIYFWQFDQDMVLREVILGPLAPRDQIEPFRELVKNTGIDAPVARARLGFGKFEVREDGRYSPA